MKRESGRISFVAILVVAAAAALGASVLFIRDSIETTGTKFMDALARHDAAKLTELSYIDGMSPADIRRAWDFTLGTAGKHYVFSWKVTGSEQAGPTTGLVRLVLDRNLDQGSSYDENFQLPLTNVDGKWKVDVRAISRDMFPGLPRGKEAVLAPTASGGSTSQSRP